MRTTLTLDADVTRLLEEQVHRTRRPFKVVVNDALRKGLVPATASRKRKHFRVVPHAASLLPGVDRAGFNRLVDEMEAAEFVLSSGKRRA
jgi:hypothetical protein